ADEHLASRETGVRHVDRVQGLVVRDDFLRGSVRELEEIDGEELSVVIGRHRAADAVLTAGGSSHTGEREEETGKTEDRSTHHGSLLSAGGESRPASAPSIPEEQRKSVQTGRNFGRVTSGVTSSNVSSTG